MRMRKKKNGEARLSVCREFIFDMPNAPMSDPCEVFSRSGAPVFLEIGAGKGGFACGMASSNPDACYFAMEKVTDCVVIAAEKAKEAGNLEANLRFIIETADNLTKIFERGTLDRVYLNFSDPWSKKGYAKRRLTHRRYLSVYFNLLKDGGYLNFKTDNVALFDFSIEEIEAMGTPFSSVRVRTFSSSSFRISLFSMGNSFQIYAVSTAFFLL